MSVETDIEALLLKAEPLRGLDEDDEKKVPLAAIVNKINALRAIQAAPDYKPEPVKRGPGRPVGS